MAVRRGLNFELFGTGSGSEPPAGGGCPPVPEGLDFWQAMRLNQRADGEKAMQWCDLTCEHASFPQTDAVDGSGSCRTFAALFCARLNKLVHKNGPCQCQDHTDSPEGQKTARGPGG
jgi:hypothetical protein